MALSALSIAAAAADTDCGTKKSPITELVVDHVDDQQVQALVTAGACEALADGHLEDACMDASGSALSQREFRCGEHPITFGLFQ
jgi:hypothetical protein